MYTSGIREILLSQSPIGSSSVDVLSLLKRRGWLIQSYLGNTGFLREGVGIVGDSSLQGIIAEYGSVIILVFWGFDSDNRLIDIKVQRIYSKLTATLNPYCAGNA